MRSHPGNRINHVNRPTWGQSAAANLIASHGTIAAIPPVEEIADGSEDEQKFEFHRLSQWVTAVNGRTDPTSAS